MIPTHSLACQLWYINLLELSYKTRASLSW